MSARSHSTRTIVWVGISVLCFLLFILSSHCISPFVACNSAVHSIDTIGVHNVSFQVARAALFFTYLANPEVVLLISIIVSWILAMLHEKYMAAVCLLGLIIGGTSAVYFKYLLLRTRPGNFLYLMPRSGFSFPSGHALVATVFYGYLLYLLFHTVKTTTSKVITIILGIVIISCISYSRVILGFHYLSDVIGGIVLGLSILSLLIAGTTHTHKVWHKSHPIHGLTRALIMCLIIFTGFWIIGFYVTHPLIIRSTIESNIQ